VGREAQPVAARFANFSNLTHRSIKARDCQTARQRKSIIDSIKQPASDESRGARMAELERVGQGEGLWVEGFIAVPAI